MAEKQNDQEHKEEDHFAHFTHELSKNPDAQRSFKKHNRHAQLENLFQNCANSAKHTSHFPTTVTQAIMEKWMDQLTSTHTTVRAKH